MTKNRTYPMLKIEPIMIQDQTCLSLRAYETDNLAEAISNNARLAKIAQDSSTALANRLQRYDLEDRGLIGEEADEVANVAPNNAPDLALTPGQPVAVYVSAIEEALSNARATHKQRQLPHWARWAPQGPAVPLGQPVAIQLHHTSSEYREYSISRIETTIDSVIAGFSMPGNYTDQPRLTFHASPDGVRRARELAALYTT